MCHDCSKSGRCIGWFLDAVLPLSPFGAKDLELTLSGATSGDSTARSVDALKRAALPLLRAFGVGGDAKGAVDLKVLRREARCHDSDKTEAILACAPEDRGRLCGTQLFNDTSM